MSMDALSNTSATMEQAIRAALIAQGEHMDEASVQYIGFQVFETLERKLPYQIQLQASPDIPAGFKDPQRSMGVSIAVVTYQDDDESMARLSYLYGKVRKMIAEANADPATWLATYLPATWHFGGLVVDGGDVYVETRTAAIMINVTAEICVPVAGA